MTSQPKKYTGGSIPKSMNIPALNFTNLRSKRQSEPPPSPSSSMSIPSTTLPTPISNHSPSVKILRLFLPNKRMLSNNWELNTINYLRGNKKKTIRKKRLANSLDKIDMSYKEWPAKEHLESYFSEETSKPMRR